jgi:hypothetical protein
MPLQKYFLYKSEEWWAKIILLICLVYLFTISLVSEGLYGDTDSIVHYQFARFAFKYPGNFTDHWAKPLFTILCAPFAQFGFQGAIFFNILCGLFTAWFIYLIARKLNYKYALAVIPITLFAPTFMQTMLTSQVEILFALVLAAGVYFFLDKKHIASAIVISLIPFARTEGVMFLVIFLVAFLLIKKYRAIPFLLSGFIFFSIAGSFHYGSLLWFFTKMPYGPKGSAIYGSGDFTFYIYRLHLTLGWPLLLLALTGITFMIIKLFREDKPGFTYSWLTKYYLIPVSFFAFLFVHSFLWWKGMLGVSSSDRFMACIMPLGGIFALTGLNFILSFKINNGWLKPLLIVLILGLIIYYPYQVLEIPAKLTYGTGEIKRAAQALERLDYKKKKVLYADPRLIFFLDEDPFTNGEAFCYLPDPKKPELKMPDSALLVWDTQFSEVEKGILLDEMLQNQHFRLIDGFAPDKDYRFSTGLNHISLIFRKLPVKNPQNEWIRIDSLDFETAVQKYNLPQLTDSVFYSGKKSVRLYRDHLYSITSVKQLKDISVKPKVIIQGRIKALIPVETDLDKLVLVMEVRDKSENMRRYVSVSSKYFKPRLGQWFEMRILTPMLTDFPPDGFMKLYAYYTGSNEVFVDDLILDYLPVSN